MAQSPPDPGDKTCMQPILKPNHFSPVDSFRSDVASKVEATALKLTASGRASFSHLELLGAATSQRPFPATTVATLRHMIAAGELIASIAGDGVEHLRERRVSEFVIQRLLKEPSKRLSEIDQLSALTISLPALEEQAA
jgi:hypothetical protein